MKVCVKRTIVRNGNTVVEYFDFSSIEKAWETVEKEYYELLHSEKHALPGMFENFALISLPNGSTKWEVSENNTSDTSRKNTISLTYPYPIEIWDKETAVNTLKYMCRDCPKLTNCSGPMAFRCGEIKKKIIEMFGEQQ